LDRATLSVDRLAAELTRYADLYRVGGPDGELMWKRHYPTFPRVLCVLDGGSREALGRRRSVTLHLLRRDPQIRRTPELQVLFCRLEDLVDEGPFAPIFRGLAVPGQALDWLGDPSQEAPAT
jgi:hypothetical protein